MKSKNAAVRVNQVKLEPLTFTSYRQFLFEFMSAHEMSYRSFARAYRSYVSFPFLSKLLRRSGSGQFVCEVNLKPEKLAALLKAMGLDSHEISHLVLCRLKNDQSQGQYKFSATFSNILQALKVNDGAHTDLKLESHFLNCLRALQPSRREKVTEELRHQLEIEIARSSSPLKVQNLSQLLGEFKE